MTTLLEQRYRTVLRLLPAYYRQAREEEMVETYLLGVPEEDQELMRPALGEVASVAALAVRTRMGAAGAPPRYVALGESVRLFALFAVLAQAASALTDDALTLAWAHTSPGYGPMLASEFTGHGVYGAVRAGASWLLTLLWAPAPAALLLGRRRTARVLVALAAVPSLLALFPFTGLPSDELRLAEAVFAWLTVAAVCCGHHADSPAPRMSPAPVGQALLATCVLMAASIVLWPVPVDSEWGLGAAFTVAAVAWPAVSRFTAGPERRRRPEAAFALAAVGLPILGLRLLMVSLLLRSQLTGSVITWAVAQTAAVALGVAVLTAAGVHAVVAGRRPERAR